MSPDRPNTEKEKKGKKATREGEADNLQTFKVMLLNPTSEKKKSNSTL